MKKLFEYCLKNGFEANAHDNPITIKDLNNIDGLVKRCVCDSYIAVYFDSKTQEYAVEDCNFCEKNPHRDDLLEIIKEDKD